MRNETAEREPRVGAVSPAVILSRADDEGPLEERDTSACDCVADQGFLAGSFGALRRLRMTGAQSTARPRESGTTPPTHNLAAGECRFTLDNVTRAVVTRR
jgi:hypothetical protein